MPKSTLYSFLFTRVVNLNICKLFRNEKIDPNLLFDLSVFCRYIAVYLPISPLKYTIKALKVQSRKLKGKIVKLKDKHTNSFTNFNRKNMQEFHLHLAS